MAGSIHHLSNSLKKENFFYDESRRPVQDRLNIRLLAPWNLDLEHLEQSMTIKLLGVAQFNQLEWLRHGIEANMPLDLIHENGHTVLTIATQHGSRAVVEYLLDLGLNPAFFAEKGMHYNAYFAACAGGQYEMVSLLLAHRSHKISVEMAEPRHLQSGLQVAVHNLQFECARKLIGEYPQSLKQLDKLSRSVLGTFLSIFVTSTLNYVTEQKRAKELEQFGLDLLAYENPFQAMSDEALPAMQVVLNSALATFYPSDKSQRMRPLDGVRTIFLVAPRFGQALLELAKENPQQMLNIQFIQHAETHLAQWALLKKNMAKLAQQKNK